MFNLNAGSGDCETALLEEKWSWGVSNCRLTIKEGSDYLSVAKETTLDVCYSKGTLVRISANGQIILLILG